MSEPADNPVVEPTKTIEPTASSTPVVTTTPDNSDDIITSALDGNTYILRDSNGRLWTETFWSGDISEYLDKFTPDEWINEVRKLSYKYDEGEEYKTVAEYFEDGCGDCEDKALVLARGLYEMGYDTCVIFFKGHALAGINVNQVEENYLGIHKNVNPTFYMPGGHEDITFDGYYIIEATTKWFKIGQHQDSQNKLNEEYDFIWITKDHIPKS